ncbi:MAG: hypothetical protein WAU11_00745 [Ignavibacteriaceae bacterium]
MEAQKLQELIDRTDLILNSIPSIIHSEIGCDKVISECEDLQKDINEVLNYEEGNHPKILKT